MRQCCHYIDNLPIHTLYRFSFKQSTRTHDEAATLSQGGTSYNHPFHVRANTRFVCSCLFASPSSPRDWANPLGSTFRFLLLACSSHASSRDAFSAASVLLGIYFSLPTLSLSRLSCLLETCLIRCIRCRLFEFKCMLVR